MLTPPRVRGGRGSQILEVADHRGNELRSFFGRMVAIAADHPAEAFLVGPRTLELAQEALTMVTPDVCELWIQRVASLRISRIQRMVSAIPAEWMSVPRRTFVTALV